MRFIDWYNFNFVESDVMNFEDIHMKIMRKKSFYKEAVALRSAPPPDRAGYSVGGKPEPAGRAGCKGGLT